MRHVSFQEMWAPVSAFLKALSPSKELPPGLRGPVGGDLMFNREGRRRLPPAL